MATPPSIPGPSPSGFIELTLAKPRRGRPTRRRSVVLDLPGGIRVRVGDQVPGSLVTDVLLAVLRRESASC